MVAPLSGLACYFARPEPYQRLLRFVQAILSRVERKNGWQVAEQAREATPYGMQRLLSQAVWDEEGVRDEVRSFALEQLGTSQAIVAIDETSFPKRGTHSAGVKKQYCGSTGQVQNCQVGMFLSSITARGQRNGLYSAASCSARDSSLGNRQQRIGHVPSRWVRVQ
jgi:SRSO17 transposase